MLVVRSLRRTAEGLFGRHVLDEPHERGGIRERQRPQQNRIDDAEDRGVRADGEAEREDRDGGESRCAVELPDGVEEILSERVHPTRDVKSRLPRGCSFLASTIHAKTITRCGAARARCWRRREALPSRW
jgi:hypothetical protein